MHNPPSRLGLTTTASGHELRVFSKHATSMEVRVFDQHDADWVRDRIPMTSDGDGVWTASSDLLQVGTVYALGVDGPQGPGHAFDQRRHAMPPHAKGLIQSPRGEWRGTIIESAFDWGESQRPRTPLDRSVIYEAHAKGLTKLSPHMPEHLRGTYAGLAHPSTIAYLKDLGVTAVQLLPVQQFVSEQRLLRQGRSNHWGYNTLSFFTPHNLYASRAAMFDGTGGVLREFKGMVKLLHEAGLEVILDVVYNHTSEEGAAGPAQSLRLIDNASYYRQAPDGSLVDTTGCGNALDTSVPEVAQLVHDSLRYWVSQVQIDGFRFDLAATLGRDAGHEFDPRHPLLEALRSDPMLADVKLIAEPWDVGMGGWQVGAFGDGFLEWNDAFRDSVREFWLADYRRQREGRSPEAGIGRLAHAMSGSQSVFAGRGPLASVNFVTAHDGFTLTDLTRYDRKHNEANGEENRDGTNDNRSYAHGVEGRTDDPAVQQDRRRSMRSLLGTLLVSAGVPMITAGDEFGRTQRGNNNAYCHDSALTWLPWARKPWQDEFLEQSKRLIGLRRDNAALRPLEFGRDGERVAGSSRMDWFRADGDRMGIDDWHAATTSTLQYLVASTPVEEAFSRVLVVVHGRIDGDRVRLPSHDGITGYELLWDSASDVHEGETSLPGETIEVDGMSLRVYRADGLPSDGVPAATVSVERHLPTASAPEPEPDPHG